MKKTLTALTLLPVALVLSTAAAAPRISAQSIIVNPTEPDLGVQVWVDRDTSGTRTPNYAVGDKIRIFTTVTSDAYVYLFNVNPDGSIDQILPNRYASGGNFVKANTVKQFPSQGDRFTFDIGGPYGVNKVLALASKAPLNLDQVSSFKSGQPFADVQVRGQENLAQALSIVVNPIPDDNWVTDTVAYNVAGRVVAQPAPQPQVPVVDIDITITIRPFSGAQNVRTQSVNGGTRTEFSANSSLRAVYNYYEGELLRQGYTLQNRDADSSTIEGTFVKGRDVTTVEVKQRSSRFEVNITRR
ncbi:DUF4384 domain-containing protein [Deinococcus yavapaiensis]|uniref:Uncharacterized protein DUF4384 n=1 Tax=Deinococcus yavapaiensis KR-236 TaxID=694435 RepID=A0A318SJP1_9DEIO|nr:DUF4384 domain-containing protein [Deinococcus yavapaiensis]PYE54496.1 uncharacterized protein DUF4384 [Deinococcus yavapaiensis KR-236]